MDSEPHIGQEDLRRYCAGTLVSVNDLLAVEAHLGMCAHCSLLLQNLIVGGGVTLARIMRFAPDEAPLPCPSATLLARYAKGKTDAVDTEIVAAHLEDCEYCQEAVNLVSRQTPRVTPIPSNFREMLATLLNGSFAWSQMEMLRVSYQRGESHSRELLNSEGPWDEMDSDKASISLLRPVMTGVLSPQPLLECALPEGATNPQVFVYNLATYEDVETVPQSETARHLKAALQRGQVYEWYVTTQLAGQLLASAPARFQVVDADIADALAQWAHSSALSPLEWGVYYAQVGLYDEATTQLRVWLQTHPEDADAPALLRIIEQARRG